MDLKRRIPPSQAVEVVIAALLMVWRVWEVPLVALWRDWVTLLLIYWMVVLFAPAGRVRTCVTAGVAAGLMGIYAWGQFPHLLALLRSLA